MAESGFARLKPKAGKPPTVSDQAQGDVHHVNSVSFNLAHASAHMQEAQKHAKKISDQMRSLPDTAPHVHALEHFLGGPMTPTTLTPQAGK